MDDYERVLLIKRELFVYRIPPRVSNRAVRATDWGLSNPTFTGRLRIIGKGKDCILHIESNDGQPFAKSIISEWPSTSLETVQDSSRYFVLQLSSDDGRKAWVGIGFADRSDSFDMNVCIQDFFKRRIFLKMSKSD